ncbi:hypothetical protein EV126DRAFT_404534 [Verticillium dahliae]|nr:hypothetical protein EV126DRAFT_404534 [Verticillium dahliae]
MYRIVHNTLRGHPRSDARQKLLGRDLCYIVAMFGLWKHFKHVRQLRHRIRQEEKYDATARARARARARAKTLGDEELPPLDNNKHVHKRSVRHGQRCRLPGVALPSNPT